MKEQDYIDVSDLRYIEIALDCWKKITLGNTRLISNKNYNKVYEILHDTLTNGYNKIKIKESSGIKCLIP